MDICSLCEYTYLYLCHFDIESGLWPCKLSSIIKTFRTQIVREYGLYSCINQDFFLRDTNITLVGLYLTSP